MLIPLILFSIFLTICLVFLGIVWWHVKKYVVSHDPYNWVTLSFFAAIGFFFLVSIFLFLRVPWDELFAALNENFYVPTRY